MIGSLRVLIAWLCCRDTVIVYTSAFLLYSSLKLWMVGWWIEHELPSQPLRSILFAAPSDNKYMNVSNRHSTSVWTISIVVIMSPLHLKARRRSQVRSLHRSFLDSLFFGVPSGLERWSGVAVI